jgi:hypothetical protein
MNPKRPNQPNPFLMGAGLAFNLGSLFRPKSATEALAEDAENVAGDMRRVASRRPIPREWLLSEVRRIKRCKT